MLNLIQDEIQKLTTLLLHIQNDQQILKSIAVIAEQCINAIQHNHKVLFIGNGGSAADAQHLATELVTRMRYDRPGLAAIALTTDTSLLTAAGNDYAFDKIFSRQITALGQPGDVLIAISTSGKSPNILEGLQAARAKQLITVGFTGAKATHSFTDHCDHVLCVPSKETQKIQECHIIFGHILCELIEETLFGQAYNPALQSRVSKAVN